MINKYIFLHLIMLKILFIFLTFIHASFSQTLTIHERQSGDSRVFNAFSWDGLNWKSLQNKDQALLSTRPKQSKIYSIWSRITDLAQNNSYQYEGWADTVHISFSLKAKMLEKKISSPPQSVLQKAREAFLATLRPFSYPQEIKDVLVKECFIYPSLSPPQWLVGLTMDPSKNTWDGIPDKEFGLHWFLSDGNNVTSLSKNTHFSNEGYTFTPLCAFRIDQTLCWFMACVGYNQQGYVLWWDNFKKSAYYIYNFH